MIYRGQETFTVNERRIIRATLDFQYVKLSKNINSEDMCGDVSEVVNNFIVLARDIEDATLEFEYYNEDEWSYTMYGWRASTANERIFLAEMRERNEQMRLRQAEQAVAYDVATLRRIIDNNGRSILDEVLADLEEETVQEVLTQDIPVGMQVHP